MIAALLWALAGLLGLVLLALATPLHLALSARTGGRIVLRLRLFGGLTPWVVLADSAWPQGDAPEPAPAGPGWRAPSGAGLRLMRELPGFLLAALRRIRILRLTVDADLGLGDPAETGRLFGTLMPLQHALRLPGTRIALRPDFARLRCDGVAEAVLRLIPLALIPPALALGWRVLRGRP